MPSQLIGGSAGSAGIASAASPQRGMARLRGTGISAQTVKLVAVSILITLCGIVTAYFRTFSNLNMTLHDDEGTLMIIIERFLEGRALYDQIAVVYGPLYYFYEWCAHILMGSPVSHDSVQLVSIFFWVTCALLIFLLIYRATNSLLLAAAAHYFTFSALGLIGVQPAHPQELCITLLVAVGLAACCISSRIVRMFCLGALAAAMAATKINLGVMAAIALTLALLAALRRGWRRSVLLTAAGCVSLVFPVALMWVHHTDQWAERYCFVAVASIGACLLAISRREFEESVEFSDLLSAASGFAAIIVAVGWFAVAHGSSVHGMIDSLIVQPRKFGSGWFLGAEVAGAALPWAFFGLACAGFYAARRAPEGALGVMKLMFPLGVGALCVMGRYSDLMSYAPPFLWIVAIPPGKALPDRLGSLPRAILALLAAIQILYAYPAAGLQVIFVDIMIVVVAAICLSDSLAFLCSRFPRLRARVLSKFTMPAVAALVALNVFSTGSAIRNYQKAEPLGLPGTDGMRMDHERVAIVRNLTARIDSSSCTMLASAPGLFSFNFLTGKPAPRAINIGIWVSAASDTEQENAIAELLHQRHPCVLFNQSLVDFWTLGADVSSRPLIKFMKEHFEVVFETSGYQFMEPKGLSGSEVQPNIKTD